MSYSGRRKLLDELEGKRKALIISMIYSKYAQMSTDDAALVYEVLSQPSRKGSHGNYTKNIRDP